MIKNIIWDFDGTLFDTYPTITKGHLYALNDLGIIEEYETIYGNLKISSSFNDDYLYNKYKLEEDYKLNVNKYIELHNDFKPFPSVEDILKEIVDNGGFNFMNTHRGYSSIKYCKMFDLDKYFKEYVTIRNEFNKKPDPESNEYLINKYNLNKEETLMIGDRDLDIESGINANIKTCFCDFDGIKITSKADIIIKNFEELKKEIYK